MSAQPPNMRASGHAEIHDPQLRGPIPSDFEPTKSDYQAVEVLSLREGLTVSRSDMLNQGSFNGEVTTSPCMSIIFLFNGQGNASVFDADGTLGAPISLKSGRLYVSYHAVDIRGLNDFKDGTRIQGTDIRLDLPVWEKMSGGVDHKILNKEHLFTLQSADNYWLGSLPISPELRQTARLIYDKMSTRENDLLVEAKSLELINTVVHMLRSQKDGSQKFARDRKAVQTVQDLIGSEPDRNWRVAELAARAGISHKRLKTVFPSHTGLPVFEYLQERRMQIASQSLRDTTIPITEIALSVGYGSLSHFSALFTRRFGLKPSDYRRTFGRER